MLKTPDPVADGEEATCQLEDRILFLDDSLAVTTRQSLLLILEPVCNAPTETSLACGNSTCTKSLLLNYLHTATAM